MTERHFARIASVAKHRMKPHLLPGITLALIHASTQQLHCQSLTTPAISRPSEFEVATIKLGRVDADGNDRPLRIFPGGTVHITNMTLKSLVSAAYDVSDWQIQGGPAWIEKDIFDIEAKPPALPDGAPDYNLHYDPRSLSDPNLRIMLLKLLEDRFQLRTHLVTISGPVHVLERSDSQLSLIPVKNPRQGIGGIGAGGFTNSTMPELAAFLSLALFHETVIDKTGLDGAYNFHSKWVMTDEDRANFSPDQFLPMIKEMGLKLTKSTGPVTTLVIDQASQPSAN